MTEDRGRRADDRGRISDVGKWEDDTMGRKGWDIGGLGVCGVNQG